MQKAASDINLLYRLLPRFQKIFHLRRSYDNGFISNITQCLRRVAVGTKFKGLLCALFLIAFMPLSAKSNCFADLTLNLSGGKLCHVDNSTDWTLEKTGSFNPSNNTITWTVTVTKLHIPATPQLLIANGLVQITNDGKKAAKIGNIVVDLQRKVNGKWVSYSSDVADATQGNAATHAVVCPGASCLGNTEFSENAFSGNLNFTDSMGNSIFDMMSAKKILPGETLELDFSAEFDSSGLTAGEPVRIEVIISFGNTCHVSPGSSCRDIDIDGSGSITRDEHHVGSISSRFCQKVPKLEKCSGSIVLTDTSSDVQGFFIDQQGQQQPAPFSNFMTDIGNGSGIETLTGSVVRTVSITVPNFDLARSFINTATLHSDASMTKVKAVSKVRGNCCCCKPTVIKQEFICCPAVTITTSSVVNVPGGGTQPGFQPGDFCTLTQGAYKNCNGAGANLMNPNFATAFPSGITLGNFNQCTASGPFGVFISNPDCVRAFLQSNVGMPNQLTACLSVTNCAKSPPCKYLPQTTSAGVFASQVLALTLNIGLDPFTSKTDPTPLGTLVICNLPASSKFFCLTGKSINDILQIANDFLATGGSSNLPGTCSLSLPDINELVTDLNESFDGCDLGAFSFFLCKPKP